MTRFVPDADHAHLIPADAPSLAEQLEQAQNFAAGLEGELHALEIERDALILRAEAAERGMPNTIVVCRWCGSPNIDGAEHGTSVSDGQGGGDLACLWPCRHEVQQGDTICWACVSADDPQRPF